MPPQGARAAGQDKAGLTHVVADEYDPDSRRARKFALQQQRCVRSEIGSDVVTQVEAEGKVGDGSDPNRSST
jgi:hypothetical protein